MTTASIGLVGIHAVSSVEDEPCYGFASPTSYQRRSWRTGGSQSCSADKEAIRGASVSGRLNPIYPPIIC
ncbi:unnamed protein product [Gadus morhua 'NCC']